MRRTALRLGSCVLAGAATVLVSAPAANAVPAHTPGHQMPANSLAPLKAPPFTLPHGRKLG